MRTIRTKVYKFDELTAEAQQTAITQLDEINVSANWWANVYNDAEMIGLKIEGFDLYRGEIDGKFIWDEAEVANEICETHGNQTETFKTADAFLEKYNPLYNELFARDQPSASNDDLERDEQLEDEINYLKEKFKISLLSDYKEMLQADYDYLSSDEAIKETIIANEYEFTKDGKQF